MPSAFVPSIAMPVFQLIAFSGAFGAAVRFAGIANAMDWYVPLNAIQGASFGAMGVSFGLINDMQTGFFDRLLMAPSDAGPSSSAPSLGRSPARHFPSSS